MDGSHDGLFIWTRYRLIAIDENDRQMKNDRIKFLFVEFYRFRLWLFVLASHFGLEKWICGGYLASQLIASQTQFGSLVDDMYRTIKAINCDLFYFSYLNGSRITNASMVSWPTMCNDTHLLDALAIKFTVRRSRVSLRLIFFHFATLFHNFTHIPTFVAISTQFSRSVEFPEKIWFSYFSNLLHFFMDLFTFFENL